MDKFPLLWEGKPVGEMTTCQNGQETVFSLWCDLPKEGLWSLWVVGTHGELRLGMPQVQDERGRLEKRFSRRMTDPLGRLLRGELRSTERKCASVVWKPAREGSGFHTSWLARQLWNRPGVLWAGVGTGRLIAVPYEPKEPFPLMPMFCFVKLQMIQERPYLVLQLNEKEEPVL